MIRHLAHAALAPHYVLASVFARSEFGRSLDEDHIEAALQLIATVGRPTDLKVVQGWLDHPRHGEQA